MFPGKSLDDRFESRTRRQDLVDDGRPLIHQLGLCGPADVRRDRAGSGDVRGRLFLARAG